MSDLRIRCYEALMSMFTPGVHPSLEWVESLDQDDQAACLRWARCALRHAEEPATVVPPAPPCLEVWADSAVPPVPLTFREGHGGLGASAEKTLEKLHEALDNWYRRVALNAGALEDDCGPYPEFHVTLESCGLDNEECFIVEAKVEERVRVAI